MTLSPLKKTRALQRVRCSPKEGTRRSPLDDWKSTKNFLFPESPILSRGTASKRPMASSNDKGLPYKNRRHSVLLKRLDLPPTVTHSSPANSRRTRRQSMIHLNLRNTVRSNISNNNIPQSIEEESSLKIPGSKVPSVKTAPARKEASKRVIAKKDVTMTKLPKKKNGMILAAQKLNSSPEKPTLMSQLKSLEVSEVTDSTFPKNRTKRRIEIEAVSEVEPSAKIRKLGTSSDPKHDVVQTSCPKQTLQKQKAASHSLGQKKASNPVPSSQTVKVKIPSPRNFSRPQTRAVTKKIIPKNSMENISTSPLVTKKKQERKKTLAPVNSSSDTQTEPAKKTEYTQAPEGTKTNQERNKTTSEVLKAVRLVSVSSFKDTQIEPVKKKGLTSEPEVTTTKGGEKTPPTTSPEVLKAVRLKPVSSLSDTQIEPVKGKESPPDPEVVQAVIVKLTPKPERPTISAAKSSKRVRVTGISPQSSFVEFEKTIAPDREDDSDHNMELGSSPVLLSARMQLQIIRNTPMRYNRESANRQVQPFTPKPDPPPSHILKQTLKMRVNHELEKETRVLPITTVEADALTSGECSLPETVNEGYCDVSVLTPDAPNSAANEGCSDVPLLSLNNPTSTANLSGTLKSSRQHQALTHSRPVDSSCSLGNVPCQQDSPPETPRSSTPIQEETNLDCSTVDPIDKGTTRETENGPASADSVHAHHSDDNNGDDSGDDDDNISVEMDECEETTPAQSKRSYCLLM